MSDDPRPPGQEPTPSTPPPGWYPDGSGTSRWWDGTQWGESAPVPAPPTQAPPTIPTPTWQSPVAAAPTSGVQPAAQPYSAGTGAAVLDAGAAFSYGWKKFQEYAKEFIVMVLVVAGISLIGILVAFVALLPAMSGNTTGAVIGSVLYLVALVATVAVSFVVQAGVFRAGLGVTRGIAPSLKMLTDTENLGTYVVTVLLIAVAATVGFVLCILPGFAVMFFTAYAPLIALDKGVGPVDAIKQSVDLVKVNLGPVFVILLLTYAVYYVGSLACYVGLIVSIPVALVMLTYSYRALNNETVVA